MVTIATLQHSLFRNLNGYKIVIFQNWQRNLVYRSELILWFILDFVPTLVLIAVWSAIYSVGQPRTDFTLPMLTQYYLLVALVNAIISSHFEAWRVQEIREGKIDFFLIRPFGYLNEIIASFYGRKFFYVLINLPVFGLVWWLLSHFISIAPLTVTPTQVAMAVCLLIFGQIINLMIGMVIVLLGFWFEGAQGLEHFKWVIISLFSGVIAPLEFLPRWLSAIVDVLPFKYFYAVPIGVLQGRLTLEPQDWLLMSVSLALGSIVISGLWRAALRRYSSAG